MVVKDLLLADNRKKKKKRFPTLSTPSLIYKVLRLKVSCRTMRHGGVIPGLTCGGSCSAITMGRHWCRRKPLALWKVRPQEAQINPDGILTLQQGTTLIRSQIRKERKHIYIHYLHSWRREGISPLVPETPRAPDLTAGPSRWLGRFWHGGGCRFCRRLLVRWNVRFQFVNVYYEGFGSGVAPNSEGYGPQLVCYCERFFVPWLPFTIFADLATANQAPDERPFRKVLRARSQIIIVFPAVSCFPQLLPACPESILEGV